MPDYERGFFNVARSAVEYDGNISPVVHKELLILDQHLQYLKLKDSVESRKLLLGSYWMYYLSLSLAVFALLPLLYLVTGWARSSTEHDSNNPNEAVISKSVLFGQG